MDMREETLLTREAYLRNFVFGVEDGLVSTVGLLSGIVAGGVPRETVVLTGAVLIVVEAFSMGVGSFLSESSAEEYAEGREAPARSEKGAAIMFISYFVAGFVPLFPYMVSAIVRPFAVSIVVSLVALFALGVASARFARRSVLRRAARMLVLGGVAILVGAAIGALLG